MGESPRHVPQQKTPTRTSSYRNQLQENHQDLSPALRLPFNLHKGAKTDKSTPFNDLPGINPVAITIGIELEMILTNTWGINVFRLIRRTLSDLADTLNTSAPDLQKFLLQTPPPDPSTIFQIKTDPTITCPTTAAATPLEIATPILKNTSWTWVLPAIHHAITSLSQPPIGITPTFNPSTGLHVHIGLGRPYTLTELKRLAKAVLLLEHAMDAHHPRFRIPTDALGSCIRSCRSSPALVGLSKQQMVEVVERCGSVEELLCTVNGLGRERYQRFYKYNFVPVLTYGTVEFRQAAGTANARWGVEWVGAVVRFVVKAVETGDGVYEEWAVGGVPGEVWRLFGAPSPGGYGRRRVRRVRRVPMRYRLSRRRRGVYLSRQGVRGRN